VTQNPQPGSKNRPTAGPQIRKPPYVFVSVRAAKTLDLKLSVLKFHLIMGWLGRWFYDRSAATFGRNHKY